MSDGTVVHGTIDEFARAQGLERRRANWYRRSDGVVTVLNVQKSLYGPQYYVNWGFFLTDLGDASHPSVPDCQVTTRLEAILPEHEEEIEQLLDLAAPLDEDQRRDGLKQLLRLAHERLRVTTKEDIRDRIADGTLADAAIDLEAQALLGLEWKQGVGMVLRD